VPGSHACAPLPRSPSTPRGAISCSRSPPALVEDGDLFRDRVETTATSLLSLAGVEADPLRSREHILISTLLTDAWRAGKGYDLARLIADLQKPPIDRVGVMDLETFYPGRERFELAMRINSLLAAPGFDVWLRGAPLDLEQLLYTAAGRPRLSVVSLAHLSDAERMFFVSLLLNETVSWTRSKSGSKSLRALVYMDEVYGYLPPVANPPSKKPLMLLLKQARAFGVGVVLATQNPVDLDYKALSNIGTWFLGRLQTGRDKARVLDGLEGASAAAGDAFDRESIDRMLSGLRSRVFLLHNVHDDAPTLFETRWVMSYLAGPLDREQLRSLATAARTGESRGEKTAEGELGPGAAAGAEGLTSKEIAHDERSSAPKPVQPVETAAPVLAPEIPQAYLPFEGVRSARAVYRPSLLGLGRAYVESAKYSVSEQVEIALLARFDDAGSIDWTAAEAVDLEESELGERPEDGASFAALPARAHRRSSYTRWRRDFVTAAVRSATIELRRSTLLKTVSRVEEGEREFRIRLADLARERRDGEVDRIRRKFARRVTTLENRIRRAEARVDVESQQAEQQKLSTILAGVTSVAGMLFGRKRISATNVGRAGSAVRSFGRQSKEADDVERARGTVTALNEQLEELRAEIESSVADVRAKFDPQTEELETVRVKPYRKEIEVRLLALAWEP
jgi:hypothetical protein